MKKITFLFILMSFYQVKSKENIDGDKITFLKGEVIDKKTNEPVSFAHVFVNQTTCGTYTKLDGSFELNCDIDLSKLELFISHIGYEDLVIKIDDSWIGAKTIYMNPSAEELIEVTVLSKKARKDRKKDVRTFTNEFIGRNKVGKKCFIKNPEVLYFEDSLDILRAFSDDPIKVVNYATGYEIDFYLKKFEFNRKTTLPKYNGYSFMKEIDTSNFVLRKKWAEQREINYQGSITHFFKSFLSDSLEQNGYNLLNRKTLKIVIDDSDENIIIHVSEPINIQYVREFEPNSYRIWVSQVLDKKFDPRGTKVQNEGTNYQTTSISPINYKVIINKNGQIANQENIVLNGYMGWERVAELLPFDYKNKQE